MATVPERQQIVPEEFKQEDQEAAGKIAGPFNTYVEQLNEILNKNLTFTDNFRGAVRTINIKGDSSQTFRYGVREKPIGLWVVSYNNLSDPTETLTSGVSAQWSFDGAGNITVKRISGLTPADTYAVTLVIISG